MKNLDELLQEARRLQQSGRLEEAAALCRELLRRRPNDANAAGFLARIRASQQRWPEALTQADKAARLEPGNASFHFQRALALIALDRRREALEALRQVCALDMKFPRARSLLAQLSVEACDWREFDRHATDLVALAPDREAGPDPFILLQLSDDPAAHLICARSFVAGAVSLYGSALPAAPFRHSPADTGAKLRVGYISGDFRNHPTTHLICELIELHDRSRFEVVGVSTGPSDGTPYRARIEQAFDRFVDALDWPLNEFAQRLAALKLDLLVDLSGHTKLSQQPFLSSRPAPVQVNYLGYPGTTGADYIDYSIADLFVVPPGEAAHYSEKLVHLPDCYQVSDRKRPVALRAPARADHGLPQSGFVFCCFVNVARISPHIFDVWMRLLGTASGSVLWLLEQSPEVSQNLRREAAARNIGGDRLIFAPKLPLAEHLARLPLADLALDTFPYNGHTNTNDLLWMGVPVVTTAGRSFAARVAGSILTAHGFAELVTERPAQYEALASALARDPARLAAMRERIRANRDRSPLFDTPRYCRHIEAAYRSMCEIWRAGEKPRAIQIAPDDDKSL